MEENLIKPVNEPTQQNNIPQPQEIKPEDNISKLPDWNIEPPIEISRGNN